MANQIRRSDAACLVWCRLKLTWLALRNVVTIWTGSRRDWKSAMAEFALLYPERFNIGV